MYLRAPDSNFREIDVKSENSKFFHIQSEETLWLTIYENYNKIFQRVSVLRNSAKFEMPCSRHSHQ